MDITILTRLIANMASIAKTNYALHMGTVELFYTTRPGRGGGLAINGKLHVGLRKRPYTYAGLFS